MARNYPDNLPNDYALEYVNKAVTWDRGDVGRYIRAYWPVMFPDIGLEAAYGFGVNGSPNENTADSPAHASFGEVGVFGPTVGRWDLPAPNCDRTTSNDWCREHASAEVRELLGRAACMEAECWRPSHGGLPDQIAVGIVGLVRHGWNVMRHLPMDLWPQKVGLWFFALACMGWSAGDAGALNHLHPYFAALARVDEPLRFFEFQRLVALGGYDATLGGSANSHSNPAYTLVRTMQKLRTALFLAVAWQSRGTSLPLWACSISGDADAQRWLDQAVSLRASGLNPRQRGLPPPDPAWWRAANYGNLTLSMAG